MNNLGKGQLTGIKFFFLTQLIHTLFLRNRGRREEGRKNSSWQQITIKNPNVHTYLDKCPELRLKDTNIFRNLKDTEGTKAMSREKSGLIGSEAGAARRSNSNTTQSRGLAVGLKREDDVRSASHQVPGMSWAHLLTSLLQSPCNYSRALQMFKDYHLLRSY